MTQEGLVHVTGARGQRVYALPGAARLQKAATREVSRAARLVKVTEELTHTHQRIAALEREQRQLIDELSGGIT